MDKQQKRNLIRLTMVLLVLVAIPLSIYLVKQRQIFRPKAAATPSLEFLDSNGAVMYPAVTNHQLNNPMRISLSGTGNFTNSINLTGSSFCDNGQSKVSLSWDEPVAFGDNSYNIFMDGNPITSSNTKSWISSLQTSGQTHQWRIYGNTSGKYSNGHFIQNIDCTPNQNPSPSSGGSGGTTDSCIQGPSTLAVGQAGTFTRPSNWTYSYAWQVNKGVPGGSYGILDYSISPGPLTFTYTPQVSGPYVINISGFPPSTNPLGGQPTACSKVVTVNGTKNMPNGCTPTVADLDSNGVVEGGIPPAGISSPDYNLAALCGIQFGNGAYGSHSFDNPAFTVGSSDGSSTLQSDRVAMCRKLDLNHNNTVDTDEVQCVAYQNGNTAP